MNLVPNENPGEVTMRVAGPGEPGFKPETTPNPFPGSSLRKTAKSGVGMSREK
jgi:hypothetical protein